METVDALLAPLRGDLLQLFNGTAAGRAANAWPYPLQTKLVFFFFFLFFLFFFFFFFSFLLFGLPSFRVGWGAEVLASCAQPCKHDPGTRKTK